MKYVLIFLCLASALAKGYSKDSSHNEPDNGDTILHKTIRDAAAEPNPYSGDKDIRLKKKLRPLLHDKASLINVVNGAGETPLFLARRYPETLKLLLQHGADPNVVNQEKRTVFQEVLMDSSPPNPSLLKLFFKWSQKWPDLSVEDEKGLSLLEYILQEIITLTNHVESLLGNKDLMWKANKAIKNFYQHRSSREEEAILLIDEGIDLTHRDSSGELPLYKAVRLYSPKIAEQIIWKGGTMYLTDKDREILVQLAVEKGYDKALHLLRKKPFSKASLREKPLESSCQALWSQP